MILNKKTNHHRLWVIDAMLQSKVLSRSLLITVVCNTLHHLNPKSILYLPIPPIIHILIVYLIFKVIIIVLHATFIPVLIRIIPTLIKLHLLLVQAVLCWLLFILPIIVVLYLQIQWILFFNL